MMTDDRRKTSSYAAVPPAARLGYYPLPDSMPQLGTASLLPSIPWEDPKALKADLLRDVLDSLPSTAGMSRGHATT